MGFSAGASAALAIKIVTDGKSAANGIDQVTGSTSKLQTAGKLAGRALAAGLGLAVVAGKKAADAALEDATGQAKLANALKNVTGARDSDIASVEDWITAQGKSLGIADSELRPALEQLVTATKDVGEAQRLSSIAMDVAARKGLSLESVSKKVAKAVTTGNVAALAQYGVATKDADGKTRSLQAVLGDLQKAYKGAAADNPALEQKKLSVAVDELQEKYGDKLIPVLMKVTAVGAGVVAWIDQNEKAAAAIVITLASVLAIVKLVSIATTIWSTVTKIQAGAQAALNVVMAANPIVLVVVAVVALAAAFVIAYKKSETFRDVVNGVASAIGAAFGKVVGFVKNNWEVMLIALTGPLGAAVVVIVKHWDTIKAGAQVAWEAIKSGISTVKNKVEEVGGLIKTGLETAFKPIDTAIGWVTTLIEKVESLITWIGKIDFPSMPDLNPLNRGGASSGTSAFDIRNGLLAPARSAMTVHVHLDGLALVGNRHDLADELADLLEGRLRRLSIAGLES